MQKSAHEENQVRFGLSELVDEGRSEEQLWIWSGMPPNAEDGLDPWRGGYAKEYVLYGDEALEFPDEDSVPLVLDSPLDGVEHFRQ